jgi:D-alanine-D-alanine ligase
VDGEIEQRAAEMTQAVHRAIGCKGVSRSEVIVDQDGKCWFIELNTIPGMTATSLLPKAAAHVGMSFDNLVETILKDALGQGEGGMDG